MIWVARSTTCCRRSDAAGGRARAMLRRTTAAGRPAVRRHLSRTASAVPPRGASMPPVMIVRAAAQGGAVLAAVESFAILLGVAALVALAARRIHLPYSVALVLVGLGVSLVAPQSSLEISPELVLAVLLPGL